MAPQDLELLPIQLERKIPWKSLDISLNGTDQVLGLHPIQVGQIGVENDLLAPYYEN